MPKTVTPASSQSPKAPRKTTKTVTAKPKPSALSVGSNVAAQLATKAKEIKQAAYQFELVTSLNLRRTLLPDAEQPKRVSLYLSGNDFKALSAAGIGHGVTFDEIIRALISQEQAAQTPFACLNHYMPVAP